MSISLSVPSTELLTFRGGGGGTKATPNPSVAAALKHMHFRAVGRSENSSNMIGRG